jgi:hypothetical protein
VIRRLFRAVFLAGLVAGGVAAVRALTRQGDALPSPATGPTSGPWPPLHNESPAPDEVGAEPAAASAKSGTAVVPPATEPAAPDAVVAPEPGGVPIADAPPATSPRPRRTRPLEAPKTWAEPDADGGCPDGYPIKAKMSSKIFHAPGQLNYDRTTPDRCYVSADAAEADGLRAAKR